jgi:Fe-S cluster assembly protein SufD
MQGARAKAFETFAKTGMPSRRLEAWKWTDLRAFLRDDLPAAGEGSDVIAPSIFGGVGAFEITLMNGRADWDDDLPNRLAISRADAALSPLASDHPLANLALAVGEERIEIRIKAGAHIEQPILIRRIAGPGAAHARVAVNAGAGAKACFIESFDGVGQYFSNSVTEMRLDASSAITRLVLQDGSDDGVEASLCAAALAEGAQFTQTALLFGAKAVRMETRVSCAPDTKVELKSAAALSGSRHADLTSVIAHEAAGGVTRQVHKAALKEKSRGVFQGKFLVARGAQKTDAQMQANALLLSDAAEANHKPELEIYADDVQCSHGSTAGALDEAALFYMRQRGLDEAQARALLIEAFLHEALDGIAHPGLQNVFHQRLMHWLRSAR